MNCNRHILLIGGCGSGKTWVLKNLIKNLNTRRKGKTGLIRFVHSDDVCITGVYTGETFEGSDRLSMAVSKDFKQLYSLSESKRWTVISEGDRFTNQNYIKTFDPLIIKIKDTGEKGRKKRGSKQTARHIKAIATRVNNINHHVSVETSTEALTEILKRLRK